VQQINDGILAGRASGETERLSMLGIHDFWLFFVSALLLNVTPGPDTAYVVARSMQTGWRGGVAATFGISTGCLVHVFGGALGLSALLAASATAFTVLKWLGAAYLAYIGITMLLSRQTAPKEAVVPARRPASLRTIFWQGALTNVLNPKVALFFLAFLPQFVAADSSHKAVAFIALGAIFITSGVIWLLGVTVVTARSAGRIRNARRAAQWVNRVIGGCFVYFGIRIAMLQAR
jgi:threonine/homoserine/homoserine lactone efflux protein